MFTSYTCIAFLWDWDDYYIIHKTLVSIDQLIVFNFIMTYYCECKRNKIQTSLCTFYRTSRSEQNSTDQHCRSVFDRLLSGLGYVILFVSIYLFLHNKAYFSVLEHTHCVKAKYKTVVSKFGFIIFILFHWSVYNINF